MCNNYIIEEEVYIKCLEEKLNLYKQHLQTYNKYHYLYLQTCLTEIKNLSNNESLKLKEEIKIENNSEESKQIEKKESIENKESEPKENIIIYSSNVDVEFIQEESSDSNQDEFKDIEIGSLKLSDEELEEVLSDNI